MKVSLLLALLVFTGLWLAPMTASAQAAPTNSISQRVLTNVTRDTSPVAVPQPSEKAMSFYRSGNVLWGIRQFWQLLIPALFLFTGLSARLRTWAQRRGYNWYFTFALYFSAFTLLFALADLPLDYYAGYVRLHDYGLSNQTFNKWISDTVKYMIIFLGGGLILWWVPLLLIRKSPRRWWFYTGLLAVPCLCLQMLVWPVFIDPLFNKFQPLQDKVIEAKILALAGRAGIEGGRVYEVNKSVDTKTLNAFVTGFGNTKRIVLWDNTLRTLDEDELLFVMGHEMGHYVLGHIVKGILFGSLLTFILLYAVHRLSGPVMERYKGRFGFSTLSDFAALPLILLLVQIVSFAGTPIQMAFSRQQEHEADRFGLELTHNNHAAATAFLKLQQHNLGNPRPGELFILWRATHPSMGDRIDFCNSYRPWETGGTGQYEGYIKK
ncbi:MAG TPA: M48 family metallopeptidase [Candidatus Acidoferrales bacterium]|jgi:STE24 endopeptidase|nr:M48 family metallopeptidase [Candidatus Acidoferrales bacterium]